jgi:hypothetical protein
MRVRSVVTIGLLICVSLVAGCKRQPLVVEAPDSPPAAPPRPLPPAPPGPPDERAVTSEGWPRYEHRGLGLSFAHPPSFELASGTVPLRFDERAGGEGVALLVAQSESELPRQTGLPGQQRLARFIKRVHEGSYSHVAAEAGALHFLGFASGDFTVQLRGDPGLRGVTGIAMDLTRTIPCAEAVAECEAAGQWAHLVLLQQGSVIWQLWTDSRDAETAARRAAQLRAVVASLRFFAPQAEAD